MKERDFAVAHMEDLAGKAIKTGSAVSRFLTPAEAQKAAAYFSRRRDVALTLDGGYADAERVRAVFLNPDWGEYSREDLFAALKITYRQQDTLGHRDILGALMGLGIERDVIGDITADSSPVTLVCLPEISDYIIENLTKVGRIGVSISRAALNELSIKQETLNVKTDTVASLRLDAMISAAFDLSRGRASEMIAAGLVSLNYESCIQPAKEVSEGAVLSVRGLGRAKLLEVGGISRKSRTFVRIGLFGR